MSKSRWYVLGSALLFALSLSAIMITGCSTNATSPDSKNPIDEKLDWLNTGFVGPEQPDRAPGGAAVAEATVSQLIDDKGGIIQVFPAARQAATTFRVPQGAVSAPTNFTIRAQQLETPDGQINVFECGPEGSVFAVPLTVVAPVPPGQTKATLYYFNEAKGAWEIQDVEPVSQGVARFQIYHFSKYGIS